MDAMLARPRWTRFALMGAALLLACKESSPPGERLVETVSPTLADAGAPAPDAGAAAPDAGAPDLGAAIDQAGTASPEAGAEVTPGGGEAGFSAACQPAICPQLFALVAECQGTGACQYEQKATGADYCFAGGVKHSTMGMIVGTRLEMTTSVRRANGTLCYTLVTSAELTGGEQSITWKDATGAVVATAVEHGPERMTLSCNGQVHETNGMGCAATRLTPPEDCALGMCK
jgi:hypothetical protein